MKKLAIVLIAMTMSVPALAQKKGSASWVDSWTLGIRMNNGTDLGTGVTAKSGFAFQGGVLKHYDWFGNGPATFRTGALLAQKDLETEFGGTSSKYTRMDLVVPLSVAYAFNPQLAAYIGLDLGLKLSSNATAGSSEKSMVMPINVGLSYDMGSWGLGFQYEMPTAYDSSTAKFGSMVISGIFEI